MSQNSSKPKLSPGRRFLRVVALPAWVFFGFMLAQAVVLALIAALSAAGVPLANVDEAVFSAVVGAVIYALTLLVVIGVPYAIKRSRTTLEQLGLQRLPLWRDVWIVPLAAIVYLVLSAVLVAVASVSLTFIDFNQAQDTGFSGVTSQFGIALAFISLVVVAPVAEEVLFRGYLFGKLRAYAPIWLTVVIVSVLFALVHFQWNVAIDVFALSIVLCLVRIFSGSLWPSIFLHMLKNGLAFYLLFINPALLSTLG